MAALIDSARGPTAQRIMCLMAVMPAKAGIYLVLIFPGKWMPAFAGMTAARRVE
jgi:hypothetical protein